MITTTYEWRGQRILRVTVIASLVVHVIFFLLAFWVIGVATKIFPAPHIKPETKDKDEIVTISSAPRMAKKAVPVPVVRPKAVPRPPQPQSIPRQELIPHPLHQPVAVVPPSRELHELAKQAPSALPNPPKTIRERKVTDEPSAPPRTPSPEKVVARADQAPRSLPQRSSHSAQFSEQQLAQINRDLSRTIAQARSANDPLRVPNQPPAASFKRYRVQMLGALGPMRNGEGYYFPIRGWHNGGYDYYYVSYEFTYADGTYESGGVPWPIRFLPSEDPFANPEIGKLRRTQLPPPPPGYSPPANLGKALRAYFPGLYASDAPATASP
jgi:hypothetical protein